MRWSMLPWVCRELTRVWRVVWKRDPPTFSLTYFFPPLSGDVSVTGNLLFSPMLLVEGG